MKQYLFYYLYVTGSCSLAVVPDMLYTRTLHSSWRTTPRNCEERGSAVCTFSDSPGDVVIVVD